ncbi:MAG: hypothetical protein FWD92_02755 [Methanomassiliicoccaceae archaeon]|nr:hypothetical protein [Methanomassiliicoccaceae archaeon]
MEFLRHSGCYIGITREEFPVVIDLFPDGKFVISAIEQTILKSIADGKEKFEVEGERAYPFGIGDYTVNDRTFTIPKGKARLMMILNDRDTAGEIDPKKSLKFSGGIFYYVGELNRRLFPFTLDDDDPPMGDAYRDSVVTQFRMFEFSRHDFGKLDVEKALESIKRIKDMTPKKFVPTGADWARLNGPDGRRLEGAFFDDEGNVCYKELMPKVMISYKDPRAKGPNVDWSLITYGDVDAENAAEVARIKELNEFMRSMRRRTVPNSSHWRSSGRNKAGLGIRPPIFYEKSRMCAQPFC